MGLARRGTSYLERAAAAVVILEFFIGFLICVVAASKVSPNKINSPTQAAPPSSIPIVGCFSFHAAAPVFAGVEVDSRTVPMDRTPLWVDLVSGAVFHLLFTPVASSVFTDSVRLPASSPPQQGNFFCNKVAPVLVLVRQRRLPWDLGSSLIFNIR
ncbi:hypothetical protein BDA96_03G108800 [Sorghum bicolor]|uniref:Uncharacterized protein n=1 Tax=Sorghum bicolor TaxID=4558 RepID=A0A921RAL9_SORBI|nr:hypothetical protein BDA96_03G108800 [Sorghum bicolor]